MRSSLSPYVLKSSVSNSRGKNVHNSGTSYRQSAIDSKLEEVSDFIRFNISDKSVIDTGLALVEDIREMFQRSLRDNKISTTQITDKENVDSSNKIGNPYFHDVNTSFQSKEHFQALASRESVASLVSRPSIGEPLAINNSDVVTPQNTVEERNSHTFSTVTRRSKRNKNGNPISVSKVTFADITSPSATLSGNQPMSGKSTTRRAAKAHSPSGGELDTTLRVDSFAGDSFSLGRSSVHSAATALDTTLVYDPLAEDDADEDLLSPHRGLLDRTLLELSVDRGDLPRDSSSFTAGNESHLLLPLSPTEEPPFAVEPMQEELPAAPSLPQEDEDGNTPFKVVKRGRKGRKSVSGHIFKLERFRGEEADELYLVKNAMQNMTLGEYQDEAVNIVGIPFSPLSPSAESAPVQSELEPSYPIDSGSVEYYSSPEKAPAQADEASPGMGTRRPSRRASVQCKEKLQDTENAKTKKTKKTKPFGSKPIARVESVYQSLATLKASLADASYLLLEELSVESFLDARQRVEARVALTADASRTEPVESSALALLLAISNVPDGYPQPVFEYLSMMPELMRPAPCESVVNHSEVKTGGRGKKHVRFAALDGSAMTPPGSLPHGAVAPVFSTYIRLRQVSELVSKLIETLRGPEAQWALHALLQTTQVLSKAPAVKLLCAALGDAVNAEFVQQQFSLLFSELCFHLSSARAWTGGMIPPLSYRCSWMLASVLRAQLRAVLDPPPVQTYTVSDEPKPSVTKGSATAAESPLYELIELKPPASGSPGSKSKGKKKPAAAVPDEEEFALSAPVEELAVSSVLNRAIVIVAEFLARRASGHVSGPTTSMFDVLGSFKATGSWEEARLSEWVSAELRSDRVWDSIMTAQVSLAAERARDFLWRLLSPALVRDTFQNRSISIPSSEDNPAILYQLFSEGESVERRELRLSPWSVMQKCAEILFHDGAAEEPHYALFSVDYDSFLRMVSQPFLSKDVKKECDEVVLNIPLLPSVQTMHSPSSSKSRRKGPVKDDKIAKKLAKTIRNAESWASLDERSVEDLLLVHGDLIFEFPVVHMLKK